MINKGYFIFLSKELQVKDSHGRLLDTAEDGALIICSQENLFVDNHQMQDVFNSTTF
ncbi:MAG: hypothetical protein O7D86_01060 [Proteobacteria bacterium]|nr:hypothetical protein [Pseudomonadota bacterium]